ncbi:protein-L-isoaspartate(D-aspartate) O-methyltransferase [Oleiagrimonas soli]|uniref:Protein-L-isoaspartate O-methyltransferase n=1 Tax=Oleiagrimonas soli TaxID=1543381 RepID=A0A099CX12_9GAMM|nr:protein-L-isoaspartate(D-aspartate) O-methyltransferase [Oleiagrimonas soli]KGI77510.1 protein-L-isoaspartate O-methyltransferase [Oleiagrimonas soli]MBB6183022.1 protein-L-isoaspartate(D-aspartate) O-methyltransferase [Oleiagrimonas soli]
MKTHALSASALRGEGLTSQRARDRLVAHLREEGIKDLRVLDAIRRLPRHLFIDEALASRAYENTALPIGHGQTISQPWVVARMTEALIERGVPQRVLEIGTGSGYQAAVLASLVPQIHTVERIEELLRKARRRFRQLGIENLRSKHDDGNLGWPEEAPFDAIILTAAGEGIPQGLFDQLAPGGVLVAPVGPSGAQTLLRLTRDAQTGEVLPEDLGQVSFVPLLGGLV